MFDIPIKSHYNISFKELSLALQSRRSVFWIAESGFWGEVWRLCEEILFWEIFITNFLISVKIVWRDFGEVYLCEELLEEEEPSPVYAAQGVCWVKIGTETFR